MRWPLIILILLGALWRTDGLFTHTFYADEALFASWARLIAVWRDPLLSTVPIDKPPLLFYLQAFFYPLQGPVTWAARLPNWIASLLTIPLVWQLAYRFSPKKPLATELATLLFVFSPLSIQFSATAFVDPLLVFWLVLALVLAANPHPAYGSAVAAGLALLTKYQAVLFFPLILAVRWRFRPDKRQIIGWVGIVTIFGTMLILWDIIRVGEWTLWRTQMSGFGGLRLIWSWEVWPRLAGWTMMSWWLLGAGWLIGIGWLISDMSQRSLKPPNKTADVRIWLWGMIAGYVSMHWLLAIPIWDRYWLPLVPLVAVAFSIGLPRFKNDQIAIKRSFNRLRKKNRRDINFKVIWLVFALLLLLPQGWLARRGWFPVGGSATADGGAGQIAAVLDDKPYGTVLYDHYYSWQWRYHFFDTGVFVSWFPNPDWFGRELQAFESDSHERFVVLPNDERGNPVRREATALGFSLVEIEQTAEMTLYLVEVSP